MDMAETWKIFCFWQKKTETDINCTTSSWKISISCRKNRKQPLKIEEFNSIFAKIIEKEANDHFHFIGFSQGGRFVLVTTSFI